MTALNPTDAQLYAPNPSNTPQSTERLPRSQMLKACTQYDANYRLPNLGEVASMFINSKLIGLPNSTSFHVGASDKFIPSQRTPEWNTLVIYMTSGLVEDVPGGGV